MDHAMCPFVLEPQKLCIYAKNIHLSVDFTT